MPVPRSDLSTKKENERWETGMNKLTELFCDVDDFCKAFVPEWKKQLLADGTKKRNRQGRMTISEVMTIIISFHFICPTTEISKTFTRDMLAGFIAATFPNYSATLAFWKSCLKPFYHFAVTSQPLKENRQALSLLTLQHFVFVITFEFPDIKRLMVLPSEGVRQWAGFMGLNSI